MSFKYQLQTCSNRTCEKSEKKVQIFITSGNMSRLDRGEGCWICEQLSTFNMQINANRQCEPTLK